MVDALIVLLFLIAAFVTFRIAMLVMLDRWSRFKERRRRK
jgi:hypothetical protein